MQIQSEVVLFQGSLSCSGLDYAVDYSLFISVLCVPSTIWCQFCNSKWLIAISLVFGLLGAVFSGWLADAKLGTYRVMKYSFVLLFFLCLLSSAFTL